MASTSFYMIVSRAWELMIGALIALYGPRPYGAARLLKWCSTLGALLLAVGFFAKVDNEDFPGFYALLPTIGAGLLIYAGQYGYTGRVQRVLSWPIMTGIGKMSYSLYLWHWPLYVFSTYYGLGGLELEEVFALAGVCFMLAYVSWRYIEQPFRHSQTLSKKNIFTIASIMTLAALSVAALIIYAQGRGPTYQPHLEDILETGYGGAKRVIQTDLPVREVALFGAEGGEKDVSLVVWGDSHANALLPALIGLAEENGKVGLLVTRNNCFLTSEYAERLPKERACIDQTEKTLDYFSHYSNIDTIILIQRWGAHVDRWARAVGQEDSVSIREESLLAIARHFTAQGKKVYIVTEVPTIMAKSDSIPSLVARIDLYGLDTDLRPTIESVKEQQKYMLPIYDVLDKQAAVDVLWPDAHLCDVEGRCRIRDDDGLYYYDEDHISTHGAEKISDLFKNIF